MAISQFGSFTNWWFRDDTLFTSLKANQAGEGIAAMKCLLALSILLDYKDKTANPSYSELEALTGLSRPMVNRGIYRLEIEGVIEVSKTQYKNKYKLTTMEDDDKWAKVPRNLIRRRLKNISNRGTAPFVALKLYITLLSLRYKDRKSVLVSHQVLRKHTKVQPNQIRSGFDVLFNHQLVHQLPREENTSNEYEILGW